MTPGTPVRIASNTKTFVAAAVLRLVEEGCLGLDDPIADRLTADFVDVLESDGYDPTAIRLRHLLTHTSGLFDHSSVDRYTEAIVADPAHHWTRTEQLAGAVDWGDPHGASGEYYAYCDTGYVLLGAVIEKATGRSLAEAVRELVGYESLGLDATWWETVEARPVGVPDRAHQYYLEIDTYAFDPSFDLYGGGGIVSTVGDLARFYRAVFTGGVYADPTTTATMLSTVEGAEPLPHAGPPGYRMGIWVAEVEGYTTYCHTGFFGTAAAFVPDLDLAVSATVNQNDARSVLDELVHGAIRIVDESRNLSDP